MTAAVWVYGSVGLLASVCAILLPIETKGRVLPVNLNSFTIFIGHVPKLRVRKLSV